MLVRRAGLVPLVAIGLCLTAAVAPAQTKVAVLDLEHADEVAVEEAAYLADGIRAVFLETLTTDRFVVFTRENIFAMLPEGTRLRDCGQDECEVVVGQRLGADYVVSGQLLQFQGQWRAVLKLHETHGGVFLDARTVKAADLAGMETALAEPARALARSLGNHAGGVDAIAGATGTTGGDTGSGWDWQPEDLVLLSVTSEPAGAAVLVDGQMVCRSTPCTVELPARHVRVAMHAEHHFPCEADVDLAALDSVPSLEWTLEPSVGFADVTAPDGAVVAVDGREMGYGSQAGLPLKPGEHELTLADPRYFPLSRTLWVETGVNYAVDLAPQPREGGLVISALSEGGEPVAARVYVDDVFVGSSPLSRRLIIGRHRVRLEGADGVAHGQVQVREAVVDTVRLTMLPTAGLPQLRSPAAYLQPDRFKMGGGDEGYHVNAYPQHWVTLTRPYLLERHEVTVAEFSAFATATGHITLAEAEGEAHVHPGSAVDDPERTLGAWWGDPGREQDGDWPVTCVAFPDALRYANWRSRREGLTPVYRFTGGIVSWDREADGYRLPTEAEWEFAAICAGVCMVPPQDMPYEVGPVGRNLPNELGIYGLLDGLLEWCWDGYQTYTAEPTTDPAASDPQGRRVIRGRSERRREWATEGYRSDRLGFRLARNAPALPDSVDGVGVVAMDPLQRAELLGLLAEQESVAWEVRRRHAEYALADSLVLERRQTRLKVQQAGSGIGGAGLIAVLIGAAVASNGQTDTEDPDVPEPESVQTGETIAYVGLGAMLLGGIVYLAAGQDSDQDHDEALAEARTIIRQRTINGDPGVGVAFDF